MLEVNGDDTMEFLAAPPMLLLDIPIIIPLPTLVAFGLVGTNVLWALRFGVGIKGATSGAAGFIIDIIPTEFILLAVGLVEEKV